MSAGAGFGARRLRGERERERDESAVLTHLTTTPFGAQRSLITSVSNDLTRTPFPSIRFDPAPSPKETRFALNAGNRPRPQPDLMFARPTLWLTRPCKYYHKRHQIGSGNRHTTRVR